MEMSQFHQAFVEESLEILNDMEKTLLQVNANKFDPAIINTLFRAMHSIKGSSATFGFNIIKDTSHSVETFLAHVRATQRSLTAVELNHLLRSIDCFRGLLNDVQQHVSSTHTDYQAIITVFDELQKPASSAVIAEPAAVAKMSDNLAAINVIDATQAVIENTAQPDQVTGDWVIEFKPASSIFQTSVDLLYIFRSLAALCKVHSVLDSEQLPLLEAIEPEQCYLAWQIHLTGSLEQTTITKIFEWITDSSVIKIKAQPKPTTLAAPATLALSPTTHERIEAASIRVNAQKIDLLINTIGELLISRLTLKQWCQIEAVKNIQQLQDVVADFEVKCQQLQAQALRIRMLPVQSIFNRFPRLVRDAALQLNKNINLHVQGEETELDKMLLERLLDPLQHLLRNSVAHGIEAPAARTAAGKVATGNIYLTAREQGGNIIVTVQDDGKGIDCVKIAQIARTKGLIKPDETPTAAQCYELIFTPGFSTAEQINEIAGRGVGLDVVKANVLALGGTIAVESELNVGTAFTLRLPLTLAIIDCQFVKIDGNFYAIPLPVIVEIIQFDQAAISVLDEKIQLYQLKNNYIKVIDLSVVLNNKASTRPIPQRFLVIVEVQQQLIGLLVDELAEQQAIVIKNIEEHYTKIRGIAGATILGDGRVALILDVNALALPIVTLPVELATDAAAAAAKVTKHALPALSFPLEILGFWMAGKEYGIDIQQIVEIFTTEAITHVPQTPAYMAGLTNIRGAIIPVIDLAQRFALSQKSVRQGKQMTIVLRAPAAAKPRWLAIVIDAVSATYKLNAQHIKPAPESTQSLLASNIQAMVMIDGKLITLLHCENFLD